MINHSILCIDMKSFYASVECVDRGLNPLSTPLVVADKSHGDGSIILAVSPYLKKLGIPSRLRIYELPNKNNIVFARPRMKRYLEVSSMIVNILLDYVNEDDLHVYSIDECFIDVTHYLRFFNCSSEELANKIKQHIFDEFGLISTIGIGPNMLLAKVAMDVEAKHSSNQIAHWDYDDVSTKLWKIFPLSKMWGIGRNYEKKLNSLGIYTVGDLACYPQELLSKKFGIMGEQLHNHANGIDDTNIREKYISKETSLTSGQVFLRDYSYKELPLIIKESLDDLMIRLHKQNKLCKRVGLFISYSKESHRSLSHQVQLDAFCDDSNKIYDAIMSIFYQYVEDLPIRRLSIVLGNIKHCDYYQLDLLSDFNVEEKRHKLFNTIMIIKQKYGNNAILRTSAKLPSSNIEYRHSLIGGHHK